MNDNQKHKAATIAAYMIGGFVIIIAVGVFCFRVELTLFWERVFLTHEFQNVIHAPLTVFECETNIVNSFRFCPS